MCYLHPTFIERVALFLIKRRVLLNAVDLMAVKTDNLWTQDLEYILQEILTVEKPQDRFSTK